MPDISRSDSNRSDASRPRVSFNRDVHVKRINGPRAANAYSLSPDGTSFVPTSVRRERPMTKTEMTKEAEVVLKQVDKVSCTATTSNLQPEAKPKTKKKRKDSFSFLKKSDKAEKGKNSSSDVDSGSSQEYRIYRVNSPVGNHGGTNNNKINNGDSVRVKKNEKTKIYDFMSLDRKKLKKEKKNRDLEYLSLEKNNEILEKMKKDKPEKTLASTVFERNRKAEARETKPPEAAAKSKPKVAVDLSEEKMAKKKQQLSPIIESPGVDYFDRRRETNVERMVKKLSEKSLPKLSKNTGPVGVREPQSDVCHNDNRPFSYTAGESEGLGREDAKRGSPTSDVIYAQVIVGGRDGHARKPTVNERVASNEVGRVFVGDDESNQSRVGLNYKIDSDRNEAICERVTVNGDEMWQTKSEFIGKKERSESAYVPDAEFYGESPGRRHSFRRDDGDNGYTRVIKVAPKYEPIRRSPTDLRDLSIRREILLSRSESQAKERFDSLKRLQEPAKAKRHAPSANGLRPGDRYLGDDVKINEKFAAGPRKIPKDAEVIEPSARRKRESKLDAYLKDREKEERVRNSDKDHVIKTDDDDNLLRKLTKMGKSKGFAQEKAKNNKMEKVKMLFKKKKDGKSSESGDDDPLATRYIEYRGSDVDVELSDRSADSSPRRPAPRTETESSSSGRKRLSTPTSYDSVGTLTRIKNDKNKDSHWLKPSDKGKRGKQKNKMDDASSEITNSSKPPNLRFFGDTDQESTANETDLPHLKLRYGLYRPDSDDEPLIIPSRPDSRMTDSTLKGSSSARHKSKYDLDRPDYGLKQMNHLLVTSSAGNDDGLPSNLSDSSTLKNDAFDLNGMRYGAGVTRSSSSVTNSAKYGNKEKLRNMKSTPVTSARVAEEPLSRRVKSHGNLYSQDEGRRVGRRRAYDSSAESATEGDSSQHSTKSTIYLHAATVGDIPGPRNIYKSERRSQSREELSSIGNTTISAPGKKTLSRSISVLAPWRPKHNKDDRTLHYDSGPDNSKGKPPTGMGRDKRSSSRERKSNELRFNTLGKENRRRKDLLR